MDDVLGVLIFLAIAVGLFTGVPWLLFERWPQVQLDVVKILRAGPATEKQVWSSLCAGPILRRASPEAVAAHLHQLHELRLVRKSYDAERDAIVFSWVQPDSTP